MKRLLLLIVLVAVAAGGYWFYRGLVTGPKYALAQAAKAVHDHDVATFEKYVDVEQMAGGSMDQVMNQNQTSIERLFPGTNQALIKQALGFAKPQLAQIARREVQHFVETGTISPAVESQQQRLVKGSIAGMASQIVTPESKFKGIKYVNEQAEQALVGLEFTQPKYDTTMVLEVKMQDRGDYWQVTQITNMTDLLSQAARLEKKRLGGRGTQ